MPKPDTNIQEEIDRIMIGKEPGKPMSVFSYVVYDRNKLINFISSEFSALKAEVEGLMQFPVSESRTNTSYFVLLQDVLTLIEKRIGK